MNDYFFSGMKTDMFFSKRQTKDRHFYMVELDRMWGGKSRGRGLRTRNSVMVPSTHAGERSGWSWLSLAATDKQDAASEFVIELQNEVSASEAERTRW
jgi:hypothetical protein